MLLFLTVFIVLAAAGEPQCSSFDYDQKTLEKMIRTEIKCEGVITEVRDVKELVNQELENVFQCKGRKCEHAAGDSDSAC